MQIRVKCFATLSGHNPEGGQLELPDGSNVEAALSLLGLTAADVKLLFVNSKNSELDTVLANGDQLGIFPAVGGG